MLRSIKQLYGDKIGATDGEIGHVKDFYFDDRDWVIRYVVVDTGSWLPGRRVLISPWSLGKLEQEGKILRANLTKEQIENCPAMDSHKPVSRQYEEEYHKYYGWPYYWQGDALWGMSAFPAMDTPIGMPGKALPKSKNTDSRLRSTQAVNGYTIKSNDGTTGSVCDFMLDAGTWQIGQLAVRTGHRLSGAEILVEMKNVGAISYEDSTVAINIPAKAEGKDPAPKMVLFGTEK